MKLDSRDGELNIDLTEMPQGARYEDRYGLYLEFFRTVAEADRDVVVTVTKPPASWVPLILYLGAHVHGGVQYVFEHDDMVYLILDRIVDPSELDRTAVEVLCGFRPECVDALWKCDMEWDTRRVPNERKTEFIVTNNGSFHRPEVKTFIAALRAFTPRFKRAVLVPCAADKPYPSPLHQAVLDIIKSEGLDDSYHIMNATGVLGLVPQELWSIMPHYDSGIPNEWRLYRIAQEYFTRNAYTHVICYTDFYSLALSRALDTCVDRVDFVDPPVFRANYLDLLDPERLAKLRKLLVEQRRREVEEAANPCFAKQSGDRMVCVCGNRWPTGSAKPPCKHHTPKREVTGI